MSAIRTILHPTDFSARSEYAFRLACSLARDYGAQLFVLHVVPSPLAYGDGMVVPLPDNYKAELRDKLHAITGPDGVRLRHLMAEGDAATEILSLARGTQCDLIIMGTHGRTGLGRLLMGSVAEQVVRRAACPVLTLKMPREAANANPREAEPAAESLTASRL